jgi:formate dehydrogenase iron-sulfur subunit
MGGQRFRGRADALHLGPTEEIPYLKRQQRLTFARCGLTDPLSLDDYLAHGGCRGLTNALALEPRAIVQAVIDSGLRGRGGCPPKSVSELPKKCC